MPGPADDLPQLLKYFSVEVLKAVLAAGKKADDQGGALKKDGAVGKQFTKEGAIGENHTMTLDAHLFWCRMLVSLGSMHLELQVEQGRRQVRRQRV